MCECEKEEKKKIEKLSESVNVICNNIQFIKY